MTTVSVAVCFIVLWEATDKGRLNVVCITGKESLWEREVARNDRVSQERMENNVCYKIKEEDGAPPRQITKRRSSFKFVSATSLRLQHTLLVVIVYISTKYYVWKMTTMLFIIIVCMSIRVCQKLNKSLWKHCIALVSKNTLIIKLLISQRIFSVVNVVGTSFNSINSGLMQNRTWGNR